MRSRQIGMRIRKLREQKGLTERDLGIVLTEVDIFDLEEGLVYLNDIELTRLCQFFNVTKEFILVGDYKGLTNNKGIPNKEVKVHYYNRVTTLVDLIIMGLSVLMLMFVGFVKAPDSFQYLYALTVILFAGLFIFYLIAGLKRSRHKTRIIEIPQNKNIVQGFSIDDRQMKKYKKDLVLLNILIVILNGFYYSLIFTTFLNVNMIMAVTTAVSGVIFIGYKIFQIVVNIRGIDNNKYLLTVLLFLLEGVMASTLLIMMSVLKVSNFDISMFAGFNLLIYFFYIVVVNFILSKQEYIIE